MAHRRKDGGQEEEPFPCSYQVDALVASSQREAFGAGPQAPWLERRMHLERSTQGCFCLLRPAQDSTGIMRRQGYAGC